MAPVPVVPMVPVVSVVPVPVVAAPLSVIILGARAPGLLRGFNRPLIKDNRTAKPLRMSHTGGGRI